MKAHDGFSLVEILVVVVLLGILAAVVIPQFTSAGEDARTSAMAEDLRATRMHLSVYKAQHEGIPPGYPANGGAPDPATFVAQMTLASNPQGQTGPIGTPGLDFGPYWKQAPSNPINALNTVNIIGDGEALPAEASGGFGWVYQPETLTFRSDAAGSDKQDTPYYEY